MSWFNLYGLIIVCVIMIPNIVFAAKCKDGFTNYYQNKAVEAFEQIGRFGCFILMVINIPFTVFGYFFGSGKTVYIAVNAVLVFAYCLIWIICFKKNSVFRALALSIIPSVIFIFSAVITRSVLLGITAVIFAPCHILLSYKNATLAPRE